MSRTTCQRHLRWRRVLGRGESPSPRSSPVEGESAHVYQSKAFFITPVQLSTVAGSVWISAAFDFAGKEVVGHDGVRHFLSYKPQARKLVPRTISPITIATAAARTPAKRVIRRPLP
jgi:hypothetical protein